MNVREQLEELVRNFGNLVMAQVQRLKLRVGAQPVNRHRVDALKLKGQIKHLIQLLGGRGLRAKAACRVTVIQPEALLRLRLLGR